MAPSFRLIRLYNFDINPEVGAFGKSRTLAALRRRSGFHASRGAALTGEDF
jgi:hypothetical protein